MDYITLGRTKLKVSVLGVGCGGPSRIGQNTGHSEEDSIANEQSGYYQEQIAKFKDLFTAPPIKEGYEVTVKD